MTGQRDAGYTLVELLISISIISILLVGVSNAFFTSNRAQMFMEEQLGSKNDLLNVSSYFTQDAQSATASGTTSCSGATVPVAFMWTDAATADSYTAAYTLSDGRLQRQLCRTPTAGAAVIEQSNNLGRQVASVSVGDLCEDGTCDSVADMVVGKTLTLTTTEGDSIVYRAYFRTA